MTAAVPDIARTSENSHPALSADQVAEVEGAVRAVPDPEIPVITIDDLGIVRGIEVDGGVVQVTITPTYSGCPAMQAIADDIEAVARRYGLQALVETRLHPAWTTDWMSDAGRESLRRFGIAPPGRGASGGGASAGGASGRGTDAGGPVLVGLTVRRVVCPQCGSDDTEETSRFGSTACKALRRCRSCAEPFEEFKAI